MTNYYRLYILPRICQILRNNCQNQGFIYLYIRYENSLHDKSIENSKHDKSIENK